MIRLLLQLRWLAAVIALFSGLNAVAMVVVGVVRAFQAYGVILVGPPWDREHRPGVHLAESIDAFLVGMVFVVFSIGATTLFLVRDERQLESLPKWMRVHDLSELKFLIWEAILAALVVAAMAGLAATATEEPSWTMLMMPVAVLVLAIGLFLTRRSR